MKVGKIYYQILKKWLTELTERKNKLNLQLEKLDNQPKLQAEKKGQISEGLRISEKKKLKMNLLLIQQMKK